MIRSSKNISVILPKVTGDSSDGSDVLEDTKKMILWVEYYVLKNPHQIIFLFCIAWIISWYQTILKREKKYLSGSISHPILVLLENKKKEIPQTEWKTPEIINNVNEDLNCQNYG